MSLDIIPGKADQKVRLIHDPSIIGVTTGGIKTAGPHTLIQIEIGPNERPYKRLSLLELIPEGNQGIEELIKASSFAGPNSLRRILAINKLKGDLTDVLYSMESSKTDFYAHQFKPVLKFIESTKGRILIADEVGLGKTIESIYIWKEVQARDRGLRLLIVCPSMLQTKWQSDLFNLFDIEARILSSKEVLKYLEQTQVKPNTTSFSIVTSLEGLRPSKNYREKPEEKKSARDRVAELLEDTEFENDKFMFDLVVFDEAHYLRNSSTQSHQLARIAIDASRNAVLLSATPVQVGSENLFNLLKLLDPEEISDFNQFQNMLQSNAPIVKAQQAIWDVEPDIRQCESHLNYALNTSYFKNDKNIKSLLNNLENRNTLSPSERIEVGRELEARSLIGHYITRTRKREVDDKRVERSAQVLAINFSDFEKNIYNKVTQILTENMKGKKGVSLFALIGRQRQMASSLVAALEGWRDKESLSDVFLWEDFGLSSELSSEDKTRNVEQMDEDFISINSNDLALLEQEDSKYHKLMEWLTNSHKEKVIIFSFYRGTLAYLERRLNKDGFKTCLIMGGQNKDRDKILDEFRSSKGPNILLSSEVGSEGIDLQFCRVVINFDLPWNPMKLEQRIGRVDRLGQKAERISIINLAVEETIEDRVLMRLYKRIDIFKESIGDLEEILGDINEEFLLDLYNPDLSDIEKEQRAETRELAIQNSRRNQRDVEDQAINLVGFSDYLLEAVNTSQKLGRWLAPEELYSLVEDFFGLFYSGTTINQINKEKFIYEIEMSSDAKLRLSNFVSKNPYRQTRLNKSGGPIKCSFDPRKSEKDRKDLELIDPTHPLVLWIVDEYSLSEQNLHPAICIEVEHNKVDLPIGNYAFATQKWTFSGFRIESKIAFAAKDFKKNLLLDRLDAEKLVVLASREGKGISTKSLDDTFLKDCLQSYNECQQSMKDVLDRKVLSFENENNSRCEQQRLSAEGLANRKITKLESTINTLKANKKLNLIPAFEGQIKKQKELLEQKLARIKTKQETDIDLIDELVGGAIIIT